MGIKWSTTEQRLYTFFKSKGLCDNGIFGLFGNLYAESGMRPKNLQNSSEKRMGYADDAYTAAVDNGTYGNFVKDSAGYGLAQWTYYTRKQGLLDYARSQGASIGDLQAQAEFLYKELSTSYKSVLSVLKAAASIREASDAVLLHFERTADQSASIQAKRASYGLEYEALYKKEGGNTMTERELRQQPVNYLTKYLGIREGSAEHKAILATFNNSGLCTRYKMTTRDAWCATAVSAAFIASGLTSIFPCVECSCGNVIALAKKAEIWVEDDAYVPDTGDPILYDWDDNGSGDNTGWPEHIGLVVSASGGKIKVIEGNISNTVGYRTITVNGRYIRGYITPKFSKKATAAPAAPAAGTGSGAASSGGGINKAERWKGQSTTDGLNVRKWAGKENDTCSFSPLKKGEAVSVCDEVKAADGSKWYYIKNKAGKYGFVHSDYITKTGSGSAAASFAVGDKVKVTGTIYGNGNGTGGALKKDGETMYVVGLVSSATYKYYIGLAARPGGVRQVWAEPSSLKKI